MVYYYINWCLILLKYRLIFYNFLLELIIRGKVVSKLFNLYLNGFEKKYILFISKINDISKFFIKKNKYR